MNFETLLIWAKMNDEGALQQLTEMYRPLLVRNSMVNDKFDEDLYQELLIELMKAIRNFREL